MDIEPDLFLELKIDADEDLIKNALDEGSITSEFWIVDRHLDEKFMWEEPFYLESNNLPFATLFNGNMYRILKGYRKKGLPASRLDGRESQFHWLYYEKAFEAAISVLKLWDHAYIHMKATGIASCGAQFCFDNTDKPLPLHIGDNNDCMFFLPVGSLNKWFDRLDSFITKDSRYER
jgi:hypothetical protein